MKKSAGSDALAFAHELADAADKAALPYFRNQTMVENKLTAGFDPVTEADRGAEKQMRALIEARYPEHGIFGEELGEKRSETQDKLTWVLDPIDGTRSFITGMLNWMTLIGLVDASGPVAGLASQGFTQERFFASREQPGAWYQIARNTPVKLTASKVQTIADTRFCTTVPHLFLDELATPFDVLCKTARLTRFCGDGYFFCMLAAGHIDLVIDPGLQSYDIAALIPIIEQAGGVISTLSGQSAVHGGDIVAAATPELHDAALKLFA